MVPEFFCWKAWIATWSNVFWNVEPDPFSVTLPEELPPDPPVVSEEVPGDLELLPHAARRIIGATIATAARRTRVDRIIAINGLSLSEVCIGIETKNAGLMPRRIEVNGT